MCVHARASILRALQQQGPCKRGGTLAAVQRSPQQPAAFATSHVRSFEFPHRTARRPGGACFPRFASGLLSWTPLVPRPPALSFASLSFHRLPRSAPSQMLPFSCLRRSAAASCRQRGQPCRTTQCRNTPHPMASHCSWAQPPRDVTGLRLRSAAGVGGGCVGPFWSTLRMLLGIGSTQAVLGGTSTVVGISGACSVMPREAGSLSEFNRGSSSARQGWGLDWRGNRWVVAAPPSSARGTA